MYKLNVVKHRGDPTTATTLSGDVVIKKDVVIIPSPFDGSMISLKCADYHGEHFVYIDPNFEKELPGSDSTQYWFAMCTCGSPAGIIGGRDVLEHEGHTFLDYMMGKASMDNLLVCQIYVTTLKMYGYGHHANQEQREWS